MQKYLRLLISPLIGLALFGGAAMPLVSFAYDVNVICGNATTPDYARGKAAGCRAGYPKGYRAADYADPSKPELDCSGTPTSGPSSNQDGAAAFEQGRVNGCFEFYRAGFAEADKELIDSPVTSTCPTNIRKTAAGGVGAGAFNWGCSDGFDQGKAGYSFPSYCRASSGQNYSSDYFNGCAAGYPAGAQAFQSQSSGDTTPTTPTSPTGPAPYTGDSPLIVQFAGLTRSDVSIETYITTVYRWSIGLAALLAVFQIAYGGILYLLSAGSLFSQEEATGKMKNAVSGLLILIAVTMILNVINPRLTILNPDIDAAAPWWERGFTIPINP